MIRIHHGCVDWNIRWWCRPNWVRFASITDAWIETSHQEPWNHKKDSHPSRMRGLKPYHPSNGFAYSYSHPSRMRGLKQWQGCRLSFLRQFASITDAWIETCHCYPRCNACFRIHHGCVDWNNSCGNSTKLSTFASITDAWIETIMVFFGKPSFTSHPSRMRGLKLIPLYHLTICPTFASITDAWIETVDWPTRQHQTIRIHHGCVDWNFQHGRSCVI